MQAGEKCESEFLRSGTSQPEIDQIFHTRLQAWYFPGSVLEWTAKSSGGQVFVTQTGCMQKIALFETLQVAHPGGQRT